MNSFNTRICSKRIFRVLYRNNKLLFFVFFLIGKCEGARVRDLEPLAHLAGKKKKYLKATPQTSEKEYSTIAYGLHVTLLVGPSQT